MKKQKLDNNQEKKIESGSEQGEELVQDEEGNMIRRVNMPKKNKHRMRAHINPMNELHI